VGPGDVPNFNQVIIGSGPTDIGIHSDTTKVECVEKNFSLVDRFDPQYANCIKEKEIRVHVDTYFSIGKGKKHVIMLPPGTNFFEPSARFPREFPPELVTEIVSRGGYVYSFQPIDENHLCTVFTPKGWHHWLLGMDDWHLIYGASRF
jgi:hypothetical protein